ncbi:MOSC domain-containing protein [Microbacterium sp. PMB16]|uniref:MOSC domain-containing protein n=1 Tax=Microbacterium sp. PMB16 TaxID=3120157 RepID=UPI003F4BD2CD
MTSRFQDRARGYVSLHSHGSTQALADALGMPADDRRFRSNIVIDGVGPWDELGWTGDVRIGAMTFRTAGRIVRCLATHANPETGVRDAKVLTTLTGAFAQDEPTLGRLLLPEEGSPQGVIRIGDEVLAQGTAIG